MANVKITDLTEVSASAFTLMDLFEIANDPEGTPVPRKARGVLLATLAAPEGKLINGKLSVTVSSNNLVVAFKTLAGNDPSSTEPVGVKINNTARFITAAASITLAAATNWFNAGGSELATQEVDFFAYAVYDSNSSVVAPAVSRVPSGRLVSYFSSTQTDQNHLAGYAGFTATDDVAVVGRFAATLSAGAGYTWTVPTFTAKTLIHFPIFETRWLTWSPVFTGFSADPGSIARYKITGDYITCVIRQLPSGTSNATTFTMTAPMKAATITNGQWGAPCSADDNSAALTTPAFFLINTATNSFAVYKDWSVTGGGAAWTASGGKRMRSGTIIFEY